MDAKVTVATLQQMKRDRRKIAAVVAYDYQMAQIADRANVDIVSVGDSVGVNLWGHRSDLEVTVDEMMIACRAVRHGVKRALVSCDFPFGPLQEGPEAAVTTAIRLVKEAGADLVKLDGAAEFPDAVSAVTRAGIPVWAQFGITPHTVVRLGGAAAGPGLVATMKNQLVEQARQLEEAGAALLDFTYSGPEAGPAVVRAVKIPVLGGLGGGPWLDGRVRAIVNAIGYLAAAIDDNKERYANVARVSLDAITAYVDDVRSERQIKGS